MAASARALQPIRSGNTSYPAMHLRLSLSRSLREKIPSIVRRSLHTTPLRGDILVGLRSKSSSGDIVHQKSGRRPIIVISPKEVITESRKVVCAPLSSTLPLDRVSAFEPVISASEETGLSVPSKAMINQLFTAQLDALRAKEIKKIGSARAYFPAIDNALKVVFDPNIQVKTQFAQGDIVRFEENGLSADGIIISNDLGNRMSRIVMVSKVKQSSSSCTKYELVVSLHHEKVKINCQDIHTVSQLSLTRIDHLPRKFMPQISEKLLQTVGIGKTS